MTQAYRLVFIDEGGRQVVYDLAAGCLTPVTADSSLPAGLQKILVLPSSASLPFLIELPFSDPTKIARVLPQFVADLYVDVDESWLFSWQMLPSTSGESGCKVAGLAFPGRFAPSLHANGSQFRLAIPDVLLVPTQAGQAVKLKTPVSEVVAVFNGPQAVKRLFSFSSGLPLDLLLGSEGIESHFEIDLIADATVLSAGIERLLAAGNEGLDISGFSAARRQTLVRLTAISALVVVFLWVFLWHCFVWLECRITERAAQRTRSSMLQAFSAAFPGTPVVEPLTQVSRNMVEIEKRLKEVAVVPKLPWQKLFNALPGSAGPETVLLRLTARESNLRLNGFALNYAALEGIRGRLESTGLFDRVNTVESRQGDGGITFSLEATWKK